MKKTICTRCGQEITKTAEHGTDSDEYKGNYREDMIGDENGLPKVAYMHRKCPNAQERKQPEIDWDAPLPEANPSNWIVK